MIAQINEIAQIWWQWMTGMFWQVSLLIILISTLDMAIRRWAWPQLRYALWVLVFLKLIIPPTWQMPTSISSWLQPQVEEQISFQLETLQTSADHSETSVLNLLPKNMNAEQIVSRPTWQSFLLLTWFGGMAVFSVLLLRKMSQLRKWRQNPDDSDVPQWFYELLVKTAHRLNLNKVPAIVFSKDAVSPAVYGIFRPTLLLPKGYFDKLSREQAEHVLLHELCHLKRGDLWTHGFCLILQIVYWFNPLLIWTRRQMRHVGEICCDLSVANILQEKTKAYRDTLLNTARELLTESVEPSLGLLGLFEEPFRIVTRLKWLEKTTWVNHKLIWGTTICISLFMVGCVMPMGEVSQPESPQTNAQESPDISGLLVRIEARIVSVDDKEKLDFPWERRLTLGDTFTFSGGLFSLDAWLARMERENIVSVISAPMVLMNENEEAKLVTQIAADPDNDMGQSAHIGLTIVAQIKPDGFVDLEISLENWPLPTTLKIMLKNAETVVIGGVYPYGKTEEGELLIFLTPTIIEKPDERHVAIDFEDVDIRVFINFISKLTGKNFVIDDQVKGKVNVISPTKVSVEEAYRMFESLLEMKGLETVPFGDVIRIVPKEAEKEEAFGHRQTEVLANKKPTPDSDRFVTFDFNGEDITKLIKFISELTGKNFIIDDQVKGKVTVKSPTKFSVEEAYRIFESVLEVHGFATVISGEVIKIVPKEKEEEEKSGRRIANKVVKILTPDSDHAVHLDFEDVGIRVFIKFISELTGKNFIIDDQVKGKVTVKSPTKVSVEEAYNIFRETMAHHGFATVPAGEFIKIVPKEG